MAVWSSLAVKYNQNVKLARNIYNSLRNGLNGKATNIVPVRHSHERTLPIRTSTFEYYTFKNLVHLYLMVGIVPLALLVTYVNIFTGPAELALIPEGYEPKHWEYYSHPITRFFARYLTPTHQEIYEKKMHVLYYQNERKELAKIQHKVKELLKERQDYQAWYFKKSQVKYERKMMEDSDKAHDGRRGKWIV